MDRTLVRAFWTCGDSQTIEFAIMKARLNRLEKEVVHLLLDECMTQEEIAEAMGFSTRRIQGFWYSASNKLLKIPWLVAYARELK